ncbi:MAG: CoA transferase [Dehalococcoidia bacterium]
MTGPLAGIRVLDCASFQASAAGYMLGDLGAEVIKIEDPVRGDNYRGMTQMYGDAMSLPGGRLAGFESANRNKRSITLDLKNERGRQVLRGLVERSDVFYTNLRKSVMCQLGADYRTLVRYNPRLIYAASSVYGPEGPLAEKRGFDQTAQARSGLMFAMGDRANPEPVQVMAGICDQMAAIILAHGVVVALLVRERLGFGQEVEVSLLGSSIHLQATGINVASLRGKPWVRHSRTRTRNPLSNHYRCADGKWLLLSELQSDRVWPEFCHALGLEALADDPRFATAMGGRREHATELIAILDKAFATRDRDEWVSIFEKRGVEFAYSPVHDYNEVLSDPQALENEYITDFDHPVFGRIKLAGCPIKFSETPAQIYREAPEHGQHTEEILLEEGYSWQDISQLREEGAI